MRKFSLFLLLATSAMPAMAQRGDNDDRSSRRASQSEQSESRPQRAERPQRDERAERREAREQTPQIQVERQVQQQVQQQQVQQEQGQGSRSERLQRYQQRLQEQQVQEGGRNERLERIRQRQVTAGRQVEGGALAPRERRIRTIPPTRPEIGQTGPVRDVRVDHRRYRDRDGRNRWTNHWRNDRRYDWRRHRDRNRFIFRIGFYSDPFGYSYRRFGIGSYLYPNYYQSNYWINDPWQYRLPPAYGPYRWVRYHNDALLIDIYSGEVVDVIHGFFW
ncbi:MAG TPA: RcnB family protein [Sphingomicrobium sp.]|nr:RcnB family protein [Sphingomicrobium sp.]